jgi:plasmid maintenance system antidote protein VapI
MKSYKEIEKKFTPEEITESLVFPGTKDKKEREEIISEFRDIRKTMSDEQKEESKTISRLLQLKFLIEDYLNTNSFNKNYYFGYFLKEYVARLEKKSKEFADEIDVDPTELSQVINKHRKPTDKLIFRLEIHSNRNFPALMWFKLLEKERAYELMHNKGVIESEKKHVKRKLEFSF